jgi:beta-lactamase class A
LNLSTASTSRADLECGFCNEAGVVTFPDGSAYAVAVFTHTQPDTTTDPSLHDAAIGHAARALIDQLRT